MKEKPIRIAVKIGSNVLTRPDGTLDVTQMSALVDQIALLHQRGAQIILISSGAVASGRSELQVSRKLDSVDQRQLFSAIGQVKLINRYYDLFKSHNICIGQVLTTKESFATRRHYLNQKNCMEIMLDNKVIPIINENDTIAVTELMFTDNDELSGLIASMMNVQQLILLSNIDGIYDGSPQNPNSRIIERVEHDRELSEYIETSKSSFGRGGMLTKSNIARKVAGEGIDVIIANGRRDKILIDLITDKPNTPSTHFIAAKSPASNVKKWMAHCEDFAKGELHLNDDATTIICSNKAVSILPVGVNRIKGEFEKDDLVKIMASDGKAIGVGKVSCDSAQAIAEMGRHDKKPIVHYDYLYIE